MPPRRPSAPAAEPKTGLIVALVFFVLMTIVLGVLAYKGYDGQKELEQKAATAKSDADKANKAGNEVRRQLTAAHVMMGIMPRPEDPQELAAMGQPEAQAEIADIQKNFATLNVGWDPRTGAPPDSILARMKQLQSERDTAIDNANKAALELKKASDSYKELADTQAAQLKQAQQEAAKQAAAATAAQKEAQEARNTARDELAKLGKQLADERTKAENEVGLLRTEIKKLNDRIAGSNQTIAKLKASEDVSRTKIHLMDVRHGAVTKVDAATDTAFVNLGSADSVRPGMSFSVLQTYDPALYGPEEGLPKKATLAIVRILGPHQSQASIKYEPTVNPTKDPVRAGDGLYKPGWKPGTPVRWALAGHFDLSGLGRDETRQLIDRLKKEGIVVDAYLDLNTLKVEGELNYGIDYLVVGNRPTTQTAQVVGQERKEAIEKAINDMVDKAKDMGITVMQHRVFLPIAGIELPRQQAYPHFPGGAGGAKPAAGADKPADEGK